MMLAPIVHFEQIERQARGLPPEPEQDHERQRQTRGARLG